MSGLPMQLHKCPICGKFYDYRWIDRHMAKNHEGWPKALIYCGKCGEPVKTLMSEHYATHH